MLTGGKTPAMSLNQLRDLHIKIALWPIESVLVTAFAVQELTRRLIEDGRIDQLANQMISFQQIQDLLGLRK